MSDAGAPPAGETPADGDADPGRTSRGALRLYLGMAPGVGKTFEMLHEGHRRRSAGADVVIGLVETHDRPHTVAAIGDLEIVPRARIAYRGVTLEEMDTEAVIRRRPEVVLVDELAHTNVPGSRHDKRWKDVNDLLDAGITVIGTVNVQHIESLAGIVESVTGILVRERIPDQVIDDADEVELVDLSPLALRQRMRQGDVYPAERADQALGGFFREGNLNALREMALRRVAAIVEDDLEDYMRDENIEAAWSAGERVMVCVDAAPAAQHHVRRAWRMAERMRADLLAVFVETPGWARAGSAQREVLEENLRFAEDLGAQVLRVQADGVASGLAQVAYDKNVGSIVIGHSRHGRLHELVRGSQVNQLLRLVRDVDVHVVAERDTS